LGLRPPNIPPRAPRRGVVAARLNSKSSKFAAQNPRRQNAGGPIHLLVFFLPRASRPPKKVFFGGLVAPRGKKKKSQQGVRLRAVEGSQPCPPAFFKFGLFSVNARGGMFGGRKKNQRPINRTLELSQRYKARLSSRRQILAKSGDLRSCPFRKRGSIRRTSETQSNGRFCQ